MPTFDSPHDLLSALSAPLGDLISSIGTGVAEAQRAMDENTIDMLRRVYSEDDAFFEVLRAIGYQPTWYQIPEAEAEIKMALAVTGSVEKSGSGGAKSPTLAPRSFSRMKIYSAPVDGAYSNKFNFELRASSSLRFKIVPVPPSPLAEQLGVVPDLDGKTLGEAKELLETLGLEFTLAAGSEDAADTKTITAQSPDPGSVMLPGSSIEITA